MDTIVYNWYWKFDYDLYFGGLYFAVFATVNQFVWLSFLPVKLVNADRPFF